MTFGRRPLLKFVAVAVFLGSNCFACPMAVPVVFAAEHHAAPVQHNADAMSESCDEGTASASAPIVDRQAAPVVALTAVPRHAPASGCPMADHSDGSQTNGYLANEQQFSAALLAVAAPASSGVRLSTECQYQESFYGGQVILPDRALALTGTTIKKE